MAVQVGDQFPALDAPTQQGGTLDLGSFRGKKNLVKFCLLFQTSAACAV